MNAPGAVDAPAASAWPRASAIGLTFQPAGDADLPFLARLYASTRTEELSVVAWSAEQKAAFLDMQFQAQHAHYRQHYPGADWLVILRGGAAVGRLYIDRWPREHRIIDIAFLPEERGRGLGTALLQDLMDEAAAAGKALSAHVEKYNPARLLYLRLGFLPVGEHGIYDLVEWRAGEIR